MEKTLDFILGTYDPFWRSILIDNRVIGEIEKQNPEVLENLVYMHENVHWLQLNTSSLGHIISLLPFIHRLSVRNLIEGPKLFGRRVVVENPLLEKVEQFDDIELAALKNDLVAIELFEKFIINTNSVDDVINEFNKINQAMFSIFDIYLSYVKEIIVIKKGEKHYEELVEKNRLFWDKEENYGVLSISNDTPIIGYRDLIECAARIIEIEYYQDQKMKYEILGYSKGINEDYFYEENYFLPVKYLKIFFNDSDNVVINQFLLLAINISINPSVVPFFTSTYSENNNISNIHPGMRFYRILQIVKEKYVSLEVAMQDKEIEKTIYSELGWDNDEQHFVDFDYMFRDAFEKVKGFDNGRDYIDGTKITDIEYLIYKYYRVMVLKAKYPDYFMDPNRYITNQEKISNYSEIDRWIHCPVYFNSLIKKYQVNKSGIVFKAIDNEGNICETYDFQKEKTDYLSQEYLTYIINGMFFELDHQLLYSKDELDFSVLDLFDINKEGKEDLKRKYYDERSMHRS